MYIYSIDSINPQTRISKCLFDMIFSSVISCFFVSVFNYSCQVFLTAPELEQPDTFEMVLQFQVLR